MFLRAVYVWMMEHFTDAAAKSRFNNEIEALERRVDDWFAEQRHRCVIVMPVYPHAPPLHRLALLTPFDFSYTLIWNALGLPATACPVGRANNGSNETGVPLAVQVVGGKHCDALTVAVAMRLEKLLGGWVKP